MLFITLIFLRPTLHSIFSKLRGSKLFYFNCYGRDPEFREVNSLFYLENSDGTFGGNGNGDGFFDCQGIDGDGTSFGNGGATSLGDGTVNDAEFNFFI